MTGHWRIGSHPWTPALRPCRIRWSHQEYRNSARCTTSWTTLPRILPPQAGAPGVAITMSLAFFASACSGSCRQAPLCTRRLRPAGRPAGGVTCTRRNTRPVPVHLRKPVQSLVDVSRDGRHVNERADGWGDRIYQQDPSAESLSQRSRMRQSYLSKGGTVQGYQQAELSRFG